MSKKRIVETHGKLEGAPTSLEQIWGFNELSKYGTLKEEEYKAQLDDMNRPDLENHARKVGVVIVESSVRLKDNLLKDFRNYVTFLRKPEATTASNPKITKEVEKILAEGR